MRRTRALAAWMIVLGSMVMGCENPALKRHWNRREDNLERTTAIFADYEAERGEKLGRALDLLARRQARDVANTRENPGRVRRWVEGDVEHWEKRRPVHQRRIAEQLRGNPASIERTLPDMLD